MPCNVKTPLPPGDQHAAAAPARPASRVPPPATRHDLTPLQHELAARWAGLRGPRCGQPSIDAAPGPQAGSNRLCAASQGRNAMPPVSRPLTPVARGYPPRCHPHPRRRPAPHPTTRPPPAAPHPPRPPLASRQTEIAGRNALQRERTSCPAGAMPPTALSSSPSTPAHPASHQPPAPPTAHPPRPPLASRQTETAGRNAMQRDNATSRGAASPRDRHAATVAGPATHEPPPASSHDQTPLQRELAARACSASLQRELAARLAGVRRSRRGRPNNKAACAPQVGPTSPGRPHRWDAHIAGTQCHAP